MSKLKASYTLVHSYIGMSARIDILPPDHQVQPINPGIQQLLLRAQISQQGYPDTS